MKNFILVRLSVLISFSLLICSCNGSQENKNAPEKDSVASEVAVKSNDQAPSSKPNVERPRINILSNQLMQPATNVIVNSMGIWFGSEGELGTVELLDSNGKQLGLCILSTRENWMVQGPVNYNCELNYVAATKGSGKLVIKNNNPSGKVELDKSFEVPVNFAPSPLDKPGD